MNFLNFTGGARVMRSTGCLSLEDITHALVKADRSGSFEISREQFFINESILENKVRQIFTSPKLMTLCWNEKIFPSDLRQLRSSEIFYSRMNKDLMI